MARPRIFKWVNKTCVCGNVFEVSEKRLEQGRGKYCSKKCGYKNRVMPKGVKHKFKQPHNNWYSKGSNPWNIGIKGELCSNWKGDNVGYDALHGWVERELGKPKKCTFCGVSDENKKYEWANKSGKYKRDLTDWIRLCKKCHHKYDYINFGKRERFYKQKK